MAYVTLHMWNAEHNNYKRKGVDKSISRIQNVPCNSKELGCDHYLYLVLKGPSGHRALLQKWESLHNKKFKTSVFFLGLKRGWCHHHICLFFEGVVGFPIKMPRNEWKTSVRAYAYYLVWWHMTLIWKRTLIFYVLFWVTLYKLQSRLLSYGQAVKEYRFH